MKIRESTSKEHDLIREVHRNAFGESEGPVVSQLACDILVDETASPVLSLVAEEDGKIVGNIIFSSVKIEGYQNGITAYILAPLAVLEEYQRKGVGTALIEKGLAALMEKEAALVFVYGDPAYYSRSGFEPAMPYDLKVPYDLKYPVGWMVLELQQGALGKAVGVVQCASSLSSPEYW
jgi:putative acetyltransferase